MAERSFRIRTNVNQDQVVRTTLNQDIDFLEILSLKINQEDTYKLHVSNYGIIVGRVLANEAFGIPNAKVSVFIPLTNEDVKRSEITSIYPYKTMQSLDKDNKRYNLLPNQSDDACYQVVGTFPTKRMLLDNDAEIEVYEKYWKYTTVTNSAGDYMIFGVPTGTHQVHIDIDLSDIGVLSQKPRDFIYKGYDINQFENANQFKNSTNLDNLTQLLSQTNSVHVYPFWGESDVEEVAITRCDVQVQYKFEPTCIFMGSIISDNNTNSIGDKCNPSKHCGYNKNLVAGKGTIEMIRKTLDGRVEEHHVQGNQLIDGDGVWCYQIPMNLDYIATDEFGNIVPTDNPKKGIATRTSVRFRVSMHETNNEGVSRHRAKYLIPNGHVLLDDNQPKIANGVDYAKCYEFGSATPDEYFRDLYWNKVYTVKNYIPRLQRTKGANNKKYSAIRSVNDSGDKNPFPFNNGRFQLPFSYRVMCVVMATLARMANVVNTILTVFAAIGDNFNDSTKWDWLAEKLYNLFAVTVQCNWLCGNRGRIKCIGFEGLSESDEDMTYYPGCHKEASCCRKNGDNDINVDDNNLEDLINAIQQNLAQEFEVVSLDFYNDWVNGCLYMPLWFWKKTKKRSFLWGLIRTKGKNRYCDCDEQNKKANKLKILRACSLNYDANYGLVNDGKENKGELRKTTSYRTNKNVSYISTNHGIIKQFTNREGLNIYYYAPGIPMSKGFESLEESVSYARLYATDIVLLGSINACDFDNLPQPFINLPSTTANIPYIASLHAMNDNDEDEESRNEVEVSGMDWVGKVSNGLFMDFDCKSIKTRPKTCINMYRLSELGVSLDMSYEEASQLSNGSIDYNKEYKADGMITRYEIDDHETRAMIASLNHNGLMEKVYNPNTGYQTYKLDYCYPTDFDGHLSSYAPTYTNGWDRKTYDIKDVNYVSYRLGKKKHFYYSEFINKDVTITKTTNNMTSFPLYDNSFYFYFGLNEGSTAIDKFRHLFYASCYQNQQYEFSVSYSATPSAWCLREDALTTDYATLKVNVSNARLPYSYKLSDMNGNTIISENNIAVSELRWGYKMEKNEPNKYTDEKYGELYYTQTAKPLESKYKLTNGEYILEVIDSTNHIVTQEISINSLPLNADITTNMLSTKIENDNDIDELLKYNTTYWGNVVVKELFIDGQKLSGKLTATHKEGVREGYDCWEIKNDQYSLLLSLQYNGYSSYTYSIASSIVNTKNIIKKDITIDTETNDLIIFVAVPGDYLVELNQYCNGELNDNKLIENTYVENGKKFKAMLNSTLVDFIKGPEPTEDGKVDEDKVVDYWTNIDKVENYSFYETPTLIANGNKWGDLVDVVVDIKGEEGDSFLGLELSYVTKIDIATYKLNTILNLVNAVYIANNTEYTLDLFAEGGVMPLLFNGIYPNYKVLVNNTYYNNQTRLYNIIYDTNASCIIPPVGANIVYPNYLVGGGTLTNYQKYVSSINKGKAVINPILNLRQVDDDLQDGDLPVISPIVPPIDIPDDKPVIKPIDPNIPIKDKDDNVILNPDADIIKPLAIADENSDELVPPSNTNTIISGNYFSVFTHNGTFPYLAQPSSAKPHSYCVESGKTEANYYDTISSKVSNLLNIMTVDKRLDYEFIYFTPFTTIEVNENAFGEQVQFAGKVNGVINNSLLLAYDENKNIIDTSEENNCEFIVSIKENNIEISNNSSNLKDAKLYDIDVNSTFDVNYNKENGKIYVQGNVLPDDGNLSMSFTNCLYPDSVNAIYGDTLESVVYNATVRKGDTVNIEVGSNSCISFVNLKTNFEGAVTNDNYNFSYMVNSSNSKSLSLQDMNFTIIISEDTWDTSHNVITYTPYVYTGNSVSEFYSVSTFSDLTAKLLNSDAKPIDKYSSSVVLTRTNKTLDFCFRQDTLQDRQQSNYLSFYNRFENNRPVIGYDSELSNDLKFTYEASYLSGLYKKCIHIIAIKEHLHNGFDGLTRNIVTVHTEPLYVPEQTIEFGECIIDSTNRNVKVTVYESMLDKLIGYKTSTSSNSIVYAGLKYESLTLSDEHYIFDIERKSTNGETQVQYYEFEADITRPIDQDARISLFMYLSNGFIYKFILKNYSEN